MVDDVAAVDGGVDVREALERLGGRLDEEAHEAELGVVGLEEGVLVLSAQVHHRAHVHLVVGGEHGGGLLGFDQALGDGLAQTAHRHALLGTLAFGDRGSGSRRGGTGRGLGLLGAAFLDGLLDVFFQHTTTLTGAFDLAHVQVVLGDHLACRRGENLVADLLVCALVVAALIALALLAAFAVAASRCGVTASAFGEACQHGFGFYLSAFLGLDLGESAVSRSNHLEHDLVGLDIDQHFVALDRFTDLLVPGRDRAFLNGLREGRCLDLMRLAGGLSLRGRRGFALVSFAFISVALASVGISAVVGFRLGLGLTRCTKRPQNLLGGDGVAFLGFDFAQGAGFGCHDLEHHLVSLDFDDQFVTLDAITRLLVPGSDAALGNGFRKGWRFDLGSHLISLMCSLSSDGDAFRR